MTSNRRGLTIRALIALMVCSLAGFATDSFQKLKNVKTVFVAPIRGEDAGMAEMLHAKMITAISKIEGIAVVEDEKDADALFLTSGLIQTVTDNGPNRIFIQAGVRLVSKEGGVVLWADDIASSRFARSASSSFAENVGKSLTKLFTDRQKK